MILLQKLIIVVMKFPYGEKTINLLGRTKLKIFNMHLRKFNQIKIDHKRRFLRFPGSYKRLIRMRRNIGITKAVICDNHLEILIPSFTMP